MCVSARRPVIRQEIESPNSQTGEVKRNFRLNFNNYILYIHCTSSLLCTLCWHEPYRKEYICQSRRNKREQPSHSAGSVCIGNTHTTNDGEVAAPERRHRLQLL